jgi:hypothetical protein
MKPSLKGLAAFRYLGTCSTFRKNAMNEQLWRETITTRKRINESEFLQKCHVEEALDVGETWDQYKSVAETEETPLKFYKAPNGLYFFQRAGFEFIWG